MKNFLRTSLYVMAFALAGVFFQISCSNTDESASPSGEKFVYVKKDFATTGAQSIWIANIDGTDNIEIPIVLPANHSFYSIYSSGEHSSVKLSQDQQSILFTVQNTSQQTFIYSCNVDGTNLQQVAAFAANTGVFL